jgi:hypothetical protein
LDRWRITVEDDGPGIPPETVRRLIGGVFQSSKEASIAAPEAGSGHGQKQESQRVTVGKFGVGLKALILYAQAAAAGMDGVGAVRGSGGGECGIGGDTTAAAGEPAYTPLQVTTVTAGASAAYHVCVGIHTGGVEAARPRKPQRRHASAGAANSHRQQHIDDPFSAPAYHDNGGIDGDIAEDEEEEKEENGSDEGEEMGGAARHGGRVSGGGDDSDVTVLTSEEEWIPLDVACSGTRMSITLHCDMLTALRPLLGYLAHLQTWVPAAGRAFALEVEFSGPRIAALACQLGPHETDTRHRGHGERIRVVVPACLPANPAPVCISDGQAAEAIRAIQDVELFEEKNSALDMSKRASFCDKEGGCCQEQNAATNAPWNDSQSHTADVALDADNAFSDTKVDSTLSNAASDSSNTTDGKPSIIASDTTRVARISEYLRVPMDCVFLGNSQNERTNPAAADGLSIQWEAQVVVAIKPRSTDSALHTAIPLNISAERKTQNATTAIHSRLPALLHVLRFGAGMPLIASDVHGASWSGRFACSILHQLEAFDWECMGLKISHLNIAAGSAKGSSSSNLAFAGASINKKTLQTRAMQSIAIHTTTSDSSTESEGKEACLLTINPSATYQLSQANELGPMLPFTDCWILVDVIPQQRQATPYTDMTKCGLLEVPTLVSAIRAALGRALSKMKLHLGTNLASTTEVQWKQLRNTVAPSIARNLVEILGLDHQQTNTSDVEAVLSERLVCFASENVKVLKDMSCISDASPSHAAQIGTPRCDCVPLLQYPGGEVESRVDREDIFEETENAGRLAFASWLAKEQRKTIIQQQQVRRKKPRLSR